MSVQAHSRTLLSSPRPVFCKAWQAFERPSPRTLGSLLFPVSLGAGIRKTFRDKVTCLLDRNTRLHLGEGLVKKRPHRMRRVMGPLRRIGASISFFHTCGFIRRVRRAGFYSKAHRKMATLVGAIAQLRDILESDPAALLTKEWLAFSSFVKELEESQPTRSGDSEEDDVSEGAPDGDDEEEVACAHDSAEESEIQRMTREMDKGEPSAHQYCRRAALHLERSSLKEALADVEAALRRNPDYGKAYRVRSQIYWNMDNYAGAYRDMCDAQRIDFDPKYDALHSEMKSRCDAASTGARCPASLDSMMRNPQLMGMVQSMMQNPDVLKSILATVGQQTSSS